MEYTALGDAINIAARMEQTAKPGTVQIAEDTYKQVEEFFEFEPVEGVEIKGKSLPIQVYRVLQAVETQNHHRSIQGLKAPMIGRSDEQKRLSQMLDEVKKGRGQIVSLIGEAGLGKSRLMQEVRAIWEDIDLGVEPFGRLESRWNQVFGVSYESARPYGIVLQLIRNYIGVSSSDSPEIIRENLAETLRSSSIEIPASTLDVFETILGVKEHTNGNQLQGEELKRAIYKESLSALDILVQQGPTIIAIDDLQWSDQTSAEFIIHMFQLANRLPILFICSFRPDHLSHAWKVKQAAETEYAHRYTEIILAPLSDKDSNTLIDTLLTADDIPLDVRGMILEKSDGNPFFMEEVIRAFIDNYAVTQDPHNGHLNVSSSIDDITIPDTLQALLAARIDRLDETAKHVMQMASVIGRSFYHQVLEKISDITDELDNELNNLQRLGLILESAREPYLEYIFRQALTQEVAYNTILLKHRRKFHKRVGEALLHLYTDRVDEFASILGHHFFHAQDPRAITYFQIEGDSAFKLYANPEAVSYYSQAIAAAMWADEPDLDQLVYLYTRRGRAYELNSQFSEALENYKELENLAREFKADSIELTALIAQAQIRSIPSTEFDLEAGLAFIEKTKIMAEELDDQPALAKIYWITTNLYRFHQSLDKAQSAGEKAIALARELGLEEQLAFSLTDTAHTYNMNGQVFRAREVSLEAAEIWRKLNNQPMLADCLSGLASIHVFSGDFDQAYQYSDEAYDISQKIENVWGKSYSRYAIGIVDMERGDMDLAIGHMGQSMKDARESRFFAGEVLTKTFLSILYTELGHYALASDTIDTVFGKRPDNMALVKSFFLGAELLSRVLAGKVIEAEKLIEKEKAVVDQMNFFARHYYQLALCDQMNFFARHYYQLALCYLPFAKEDFNVTIQKTNEFMQFLQATGVEFLTPELLLLISKSQIALGNWDEAEITLEEARSAAEKLGSRRSQWKVDYYMGLIADHQGNQAEAAAYYKNSSDNIAYILDHISNDDLKEHFLNREDVKFVLAAEVEPL
jgi:predicted ATPase